MANDLDDIRASADCPVCGRELSVTYRTLRLGRTIECQGCGVGFAAGGIAEYWGGGW